MAGKKGVGHFSPKERDKLEALYSHKVSVAEISQYLGRHRSTIYKELKRGRYTRRTSDWEEVIAYSSDIAQQDYYRRASAKGAPLKIGRDFTFADYIEQKIIRERYSPAAALAAIRLEGLTFTTSICTKTLYNYINSGLFLQLSNHHLLYKSRKKLKQKPERPRRVKRPLCTSIEERPREVNARESFGHWEMDTVVGKAKGGGPVLLVLTERLTRYEIIRKLREKTTAEVVRCLDQIERQLGARFRQVFQTITVDNGSEFMDTSGLERSCRRKGSRTNVYYCHPYSSWERGSNENANGIIRRFIPKGTPIEQYSSQQIARIQQWINCYPRQVLGYQNAQNLFDAYQQTA